MIHEERRSTADDLDQRSSFDLVQAFDVDRADLGRHLLDRSLHRRTEGDGTWVTACRGRDPQAHDVVADADKGQGHVGRQTRLQ